MYAFTELEQAAPKAHQTNAGLSNIIYQRSRVQIQRRNKLQERPMKSLNNPHYLMFQHFLSFPFGLLLTLKIQRVHPMASRMRSRGADVNQNN